MPGQPLYWTRQMVLDLPEDGNRYEVVHGELLVTPAPRLIHQAVVGELAFQLRLYLKANPVGLVLTSPADLSIGEDTTVQPDVFVTPTLDPRTTSWTDVPLDRILLVAEVVSASTRRSDRFQKRRLYQEAGIPLFWIVDVDARAVEIWAPEDRFPRVESETLVWQPAGVAESFRLSLAELFRGP